MKVSEMSESIPKMEACVKVLDSEAESLKGRVNTHRRASLRAKAAAIEEEVSENPKQAIRVEVGSPFHRFCPRQGESENNENKT